MAAIITKANRNCAFRGNADNELLTLIKLISGRKYGPGERQAHRMSGPMVGIMPSQHNKTIRFSSLDHLHLEITRVISPILYHCSSAKYICIIGDSKVGGNVVI